MPLVPQRTSFPVTGGQEQGVAPELIEAPSLALAHNCNYLRPGELTKRRGWRTNPELHALPQPQKLDVRDNEVIWIGEQRTTTCRDRVVLGIDAHVPAEATELTPGPTWLEKGYLPRFNTRRILDLAHNVAGAQVTDFDCAFAGNTQDRTLQRGVVLVAWRYSSVVSGRIDYAVVDVASGAIVTHQTLVTDAAAYGPIRVVSCLHPYGTSFRWYFHIFFGSGGWENTSDDETGDVHWISILAATPSVLGEESVVTSNVTGFDVASTDPSPGGGYEQRVYFVSSRVDTPNLYLGLYTPAVDGNFVLQTSTPTALAVTTGFRSVTFQVKLDCSPDGREIAAHWVTSNGTIESGGLVGTWANRFATWTAGPASNRTLVCNGDTSPTINCTASSWYGLSVGWSGTSVYQSTTRYDNWVITAEPHSGATSGMQHGWVMRTGTPPVAITSGRQHAFQTYSRHWNYRGVSYVAAIRGNASDVVVLEVVALEIPPSGGEGDPPPISPYRAGRALPGELAQLGGTIIEGGRSYPLSRARNSVVKSHYDDGRFFAAFPIVTVDGIESRICLLEFTAVDPQQYNSADLGGGLYMAAGIPWCYDGGNGHEIGFSHRPQLSAQLGSVYDFTAVTVEVGPGTPSAVAEGDYYLALVWESTDAMGRRAQSAPSYFPPPTASPLHVDGTAPGQFVRIQFQTLGPTSRSNVRAVFYTSSDGGLNYYRSSAIIPYQVMPSTHITHDMGYGEFSHVNAPKLYTSMSIVENSPLPPMRFACAWQNRLWFANDYDIWFSREVLDGEEPAFSDTAFTMKLPVKCSGMASLDDRLALFGEDSIYYTAGDGPTDTGAGGAFLLPQRLPSDFGCIDARSICRTEKGIVFQSRRGIELLDRGLQTNLISGGVDRYMRELGWSEILSASLDPQTQIVRFVVHAPGTEETMIFCWHAELNAWTTASVPRVSNSSGRDVAAGIVRAFNANWMAIGDRNVNIANPTCSLMREMSSGKTDGFTTSPQWYGVSGETANIKLDGLLGFARVWRAYFLVKNRGTGTHETGFVVGYDIDYKTADVYFNVSTPGARVWSTAEDLAGCATESPNHWRFQVHIDKQQCSAIRLKFADCVQTSDAQGFVAPVDTDFTIVGFGLEWGQEPGTGRGHYRSKK